MDTGTCRNIREADGIAKETTGRNPREENDKIPYSDWKGVYRSEMKNKTKNRNEIESRYKSLNIISKNTTEKKKKP